MNRDDASVHRARTNQCGALGTGEIHIGFGRVAIRCDAHPWLIDDEDGVRVRNGQRDCERASHGKHMSPGLLVSHRSIIGSRRASLL